MFAFGESFKDKYARLHREVFVVGIIIQLPLDLVAYLLPIREDFRFLLIRIECILALELVLAEPLGYLRFLIDWHQLHIRLRLPRHPHICLGKEDVVFVAHFISNYE